MGFSDGFGIGFYLDICLCRGNFLGGGNFLNFSLDYYFIIVIVIVIVVIVVIIVIIIVLIVLIFLVVLIVNTSWGRDIDIDAEFFTSGRNSLKDFYVESMLLSTACSGDNHNQTYQESQLPRKIHQDKVG